jgi:hypothetical protein
MAQLEAVALICEKIRSSYIELETFVIKIVSISSCLTVSHNSDGKAILFS